MSIFSPNYLNPLLISAPLPKGQQSHVVNPRRAGCFRKILKGWGERAREIRGEGDSGSVAGHLCLEMNKGWILAALDPSSHFGVQCGNPRWGRMGCFMHWTESPSGHGQPFVRHQSCFALPGEPSIEAHGLRGLRRGLDEGIRAPTGKNNVTSCQNMATGWLLFPQWQGGPVEPCIFQGWELGGENNIGCVMNYTPFHQTPVEAFADFWKRRSGVAFSRSGMFWVEYLGEEF